MHLIDDLCCHRRLDIDIMGGRNMTNNIANIMYDIIHDIGYDIGHDIIDL